MIPRLLAGLSDHCPEVINVLKYRAWELYQWHPNEYGIPTKPNYYPTEWGTAVPEFPQHSKKIKTCTQIVSVQNQEIPNETQIKEEISKVKRRVPKWKLPKNQEHYNSRLLNLFMLLSHNDQHKVNLKQFKEEFNKLYGDITIFNRNYPQMKNFGKKNHAKVFSEDINGEITLWEPVALLIKSIYS